MLEVDEKEGAYGKEKLEISRNENRVARIATGRLLCVGGNQDLSLKSLFRRLSRCGDVVGRWNDSSFG